MPPELAVIVPVLDEAARLPALIDDLRRQQAVAAQIILGDGGSRDCSREIARRLGVAWVAAPTGRGAQMNRAAARASAPWLLFLHADSRLTRRDQLARALAALQAAGGGAVGHFPLRFARERSGHRRLYRYMEAKSALNRPGTFNGDQGLLVAARFFHALGGFDERLPFMEDQRIGAQIRRRGRWITLPDALLTSARRFEAEGPYRRYLLMGLMMACEHTGLHEFFQRAPHVYRAHTQSRRLPLAPFFGLALRCLRERPAGKRLPVLRAAAACLRDNAWQLPLALRTLLQRADEPPPAADGRRRLGS